MQPVGWSPVHNYAPLSRAKNNPVHNFTSLFNFDFNIISIYTFFPNSPITW
jgi:hypothetical protein